jgi:polar amino acid transport system substrate-binding protein
MNNKVIMKRLLLLILILQSNLSLINADKKISICIDQNSWLPFTFVDVDEPSGIHVELAKKALSNLGYDLEISSMPWKRCLYGIKHGTFDAILSVSYKSNRNEYMYYPEDAEYSEKSELRVTSAEYVIVSCSDNPYVWDGDDQSLPEPVRIAFGSGTADRLKEKNIYVETARSDKNIYAMLKRDKTGVVLSYKASAEAMLRTERYKNIMKILPIPYISKSYYMGISRKGQISFKEAQIIWEEIAKIRDNEIIMDSLVFKIENQVDHLKP